MATTPTKQRIVEAGAELFRHKGYTGTGVKEIVAAARAPFGSLYHHFPGGKEELAEAIIRWSGAMYGQLGPAVLGPAPDPVTGVHAFFGGAAEHLRETDYADACPIATVALEVASTSEPLRRATADVFQSWIDGLAAYFAANGSRPTARASWRSPCSPRSRARSCSAAHCAAPSRWTSRAGRWPPRCATRWPATRRTRYATRCQSAPLPIASRRTRPSPAALISAVSVAASSGSVRCGAMQAATSRVVGA